MARRNSLRESNFGSIPGCAHPRVPARPTTRLNAALVPMAPPVLRAVCLLEPRRVPLDALARPRANNPLHAHLLNPPAEYKHGVVRDSEDEPVECRNWLRSAVRLAASAPQAPGPNARRDTMRGVDRAWGSSEGQAKSCM